MYLSGIKESYLPDKNLVSGQLPDRFDEVIVSIDDGELMLFIVEGGGTFLNDGIPVHIPVTALCIQCVQKRDGGVVINFLLSALDALRNFQKAAGGNRGGGGVLKRTVGRLAEINGNQIGIRCVHQEIVRNPLGTGQILRIFRMDVAQRKSVERPALSSGPQGFPLCHSLCSPHRLA